MIVLGIAAAFGAVPDSVLWYHGHGGTTLDNETFVTYVEGTLFGDVVQIASWDQVDLSAYRAVILARPTQPFDPSEVSQIQAWMALRGKLIVVGDQGASADPGAMNTLLTDLGSTIQLEDTDELAPDGLCAATDVVDASPFFSIGNGVSTINHGDLDPGLGRGLLVRQQGDPAGTWTLVGQEGSILVTADYDLFSGNTCGLQSKTSFWNGVYFWGCDYDEDGARDPSCGGNDCDDLDDGVGGSSDYVDGDGDGFGDLLLPCGQDTVPEGGDCDDTDLAVFPGAPEVCDFVDNDCNTLIDDEVTDGTTWFEDLDLDGFGSDITLEACEQPVGHTLETGDCNDAFDDVNPLVVESCNGRDDNCDGRIDEGCTVPPPPPPPPPSKNCATALPGSGWLSLLAVVGLRRRARR